MVDLFAQPGYRFDDESHPPLDSPEYMSSRLRVPRRPLVSLPHTATETSGPSFASAWCGPVDHDLTRQHAGEPLGERIIVFGRIVDGDGTPIPSGLVEIWQANAAGRYRHDGDQHPAPLDPNFTGGGRCVTDADGRYEFLTIKPGAYPWRNHSNAWRPAHIHFSLLGRALAQRLVTQMYFPGDPLMEHDPILLAVPEPARERLVARFSREHTAPEWALAYEFDVVLRGRDATPPDPDRNVPS
jgi:protocatechuate 3,4-dioxygenase beta subunit